MSQKLTGFFIFMKKSNFMKRKITAFLLFLSCNLTLFAQYEFHQPSGYTAKTYQKMLVKVGNQQQPHTQKIMKLIQDNWTICPVFFYSEKLDPSWLAEGICF